MLLRAIRDLLGLYWVPADGPDERVRQAALFVKDLSGFPEAVVFFAIHEWRTRQDRKPSIASLHQLCMVRQHGLMKRLKDLTPPPVVYAKPLDADEIARREAIVAGALSNAGFTKRPTGWVSPGLVAEEKAEVRRPHWSETAGPDDIRWAALRKSRAANGHVPEGTP